MIGPLFCDLLLKGVSEILSECVLLAEVSHVEDPSASAPREQQSLARVKITGTTPPSSGPSVNVDGVCRKCPLWIFPCFFHLEVCSPTETASTMIS